MQDVKTQAEILNLFPSVDCTAEKTFAQKTETFEALIADYASDVDEISAQYGISRDEVIAGIRYRYEKVRAFFPNISWSVNVYRYNLQFDAAAEKILERYKGYKISRELATKIAQCEDADQPCAKCNGVICTKAIQFQRHSVSIVNGKVTLNVHDVCNYERERRLRKKIDRAQIPPRYAGLTFEDYSVDAGNKNAVNWAKKIIQNPQQGLFISGSAGTGKTMLAAILAQELMKAGKSVLFVDVPTLLDNLRKTFNKKTSDDDTTLDEMMKALSAADVLILDDMGVENPTAWVAERVYLIVNDRYNAGKPVIVTSNYRLETLINRFAEEITGTRIVSRLQQMCKLAEISGTDRRLIRRKKT